MSKQKYSSKHSQTYVHMVIPPHERAKPFYFIQQTAKNVMPLC